MKLTKSQRDYIRFHAKNMTDVQIAKEIGLNASMVSMARKKMGLGWPDKEAIIDSQKDAKRKNGFGLAANELLEDDYLVASRKGNGWFGLMIVLLTMLVVGVYANTLTNTFVYDDKDVIVKKNFIKYTKNIPVLFTADCLIRSGEMSYRPVVTFSYIVDYALWTSIPHLRYFEAMNFLDRSDLKNGDDVVSFLKDKSEDVNQISNGKLMQKAEELLGETPKKDFSSVWKYRPLGFHITNTALHLLTVWVFFACVVQLSGANLRAFLMSMLFAVHTLNTETVNCISYREDIFTALFCLGSLALYIRGINDHKKTGVLYALSLVFYFFAVFSKEMALSFPILIVIYDFYFVCDFKMRKSVRRILPIYLGYGLISVFYLVVRFIFFRDIHETQIPYPGGSFYSNVLTMMTVFLHYIRLLVVPVNLTCHYLFDTKKSLLEAHVLYSIFVLLAIAFMIFKYASRHKMLSFSALAFFVSLLPVMNIIPIVNIVAERYLYYPLAFFCLFIVLFIEEIHKKIFPPLNLSRYKNISVISLLMVITVIMSIMSYQRNFKWFDNFSLWKSAVKVQPWSAKAHNNLGLAFKERGRSALAIASYEEAMRVNPHYTDAGNNLAILYGALGEHDKEIETYLRCLKIKHDDATMNYNVGMAFMEQGALDKGAKHVEKAVKLEPKYANAHNGLAIIYSRQGRIEDAKRHWEISLSIDPDHSSAKANYSRLLKHLEKKQK